jgi:DNA adenine methylase
MSAPAATATPSPGPQPFIKWVGGKRQLLPELLARMPPTFERYFEPFIGGGALFWTLQPRDAVLGDMNERLCKTYMAVRDSVDDVITRLHGHARLHKQNGERHFYAVRDIAIDAYPNAAIAAWFIYLNKTCFNGLYRVNGSGKFNTPVGAYVNPTICDEANLRACAATLAYRATVLHADFEKTTAEAKAGDFVYFDPPYAPVSASADFTSYTKAGFDVADQIRLRDHALALKRRGVHVLLSNSAAPLIYELYAVSRDFTIEEVDAKRAINSKGDARGAVKEVLIR